MNFQVIKFFKDLWTVKRIYGQLKIILELYFVKKVTVNEGD